MSIFYLENGTILSISFKVSTAYVLKSREILNEEPFDITMPVPLLFAHIWFKFIESNFLERFVVVFLELLEDQDRARHQYGNGQPITMKRAGLGNKISAIKAKI